MKTQLLIISSVFLTGIASAAQIPFTEESENHFVWNSGPIAPAPGGGGTGGASEFFSVFGGGSGIITFSNVLLRDGYSSEIQIILSNGTTFLFDDNGPLEPGSGTYHIGLPDPNNFFRLEAAYEGYTEFGGFANINVRGWLVDPTPKGVPDGGTTFLMLSLGVLGLAGVKRKLFKA